MDATLSGATAERADASRADDWVMTDDLDLDDAIQVATERTATAQTEVRRSIDVPAALPAKVEVAVNRAEDLHVLAEEAAGEPDASR